MPFEISPAIVNPWTIEHAKEAAALTDLVTHLRRVPASRWDFRVVREMTDCGTFGCAMGHAFDVPSCVAIGLCVREDFTVNEKVFALPPVVNNAIFYGIGAAYHNNERLPSAHDVADRIEHWLATGELR